MKPNAIAMHADQAEFYQYRTPYLKNLFGALADKLGLNGAAQLLDVCCGSGELATGFADFAGHVFAIDGSAEMLANAKAHPKISYAQCDVNAETFQAPVPIDHIVIGRAVHWIEPEGLKSLARKNLKNGGKIVICSSQWDSQEAWYPVYRALIKPYRHDAQALDYTGQKTLQGIGYKAVAQCQVTSGFGCSIDYLIRERLSTVYGDVLQRLQADMEGFTARMTTALSPYLQGGKLTGTISSWGIIYERA